MKSIIRTALLAGLAALSLCLTLSAARADDAIPASRLDQVIKAGKLRALAVTTARRSVALPDVPTLDEAGLKGFDMGTWFGVL
ncbi:tripartite tricarboxylate transporter substrate-binding protein, partial [Escherichia coli]|uniref:tripartite tricarboxylate transporter substrate-binding protein n=1 Tax=Escherichia coli TaxID=562 RepID=UPI0039E0AEF7